ncbi:MAG: PD-(D/E)XK nuclease family protein [Clostridiales bacterium]|nr:PD-(D/E)XK nuclease family protein [Clostridiales bacterium]
MIRIIPYTSYGPVTELAVEREMKARKDGQNTVFIVPESVKASVERLVFDRLVEGKPSGDDVMTSFGPVSAGALDVDVLSFVRLSYQILSMTGRESDSDDLLLRNVIYRVLTDSPSDFPNLNKLRTHFEYVDMLVDLIGDFRRYDIDADMIKSRIGSEGLTDSKLNEIALLIERVNELGEKFDLPVNENLPDTASAIIRSLSSGDAKVSRRLKSLSSFVKSRFIVTGLGSARNLTPQELRLIKSLSDAGAEVIVYASARDEGSDGSFSEFGENTIEVMQQMGGTICGAIEDGTSCRNRLNESSKHYAMGEAVYKCVLPEDDSIRLFSYTMEDDAVSFVANEINRLVREENKYRYSDIRVFCADEEYKDRIKSIFRLFDLQMFIDSKVILMNTPVVRFVLGLLDTSIHNYESSDVLRLLRTGVLTGARADLVDVFDNWLLRENIRDKNRLFNENFYKLTYEVDGQKIDKDPFRIFDNGELIEDGPGYLYRHIVKDVLEPIRKVTDEIDSKATIAGKATVLASYVGSLKEEVEALRDEFIDRGENDTALAIVKGYQEIMKLLSSFTGELNESEISREQFASLVRTDMKNKSMGSIPLCADSVEISSIESCIYTSCKVMFVLGATSDNFPHKPSHEGIIPSSELQTLGLPDKSGMRSKQEFIEASLLLNSVTDMIVMITPSSEMPSPVFSFLRTAVSEGDEDITITNGDFVTPVYGQAVKRRHLAQDPDSSFITPEHMKMLLTGREKCSVTSIENYNSCPLKYMLDYALRIKVRTDGSNVESNELGSLCHSMFEYAMSDVKDELSTKSIDDVISEASSDAVIRKADEYFRKAISEEQIKNPDKYTARYAVYPGIKAKRIFEKAYPAMLDYYKESGYRPEDFEVELSGFRNKLDINTSADGIEFNFEFKGSIDRVDKNEEGMLRVVDYKTYAKKIEPDETADGVQIQLFTYAYGLELQPGFKVDNVGYIRTLLPTSKSKQKEKLFNYISLDKKYDLSKMMEHSYAKLKQACENIAKGHGTAQLTASSFDKACKFCSFKGSCGRLPNQPKPDDADTKTIVESWKVGGKK